MEHIFGCVATQQAAVVWLVFPTFEIFANTKNACDPFGPTALVSWGGSSETSGLPVFHKGWSGTVLEQHVLEVFANFLSIKDKLPRFSLDVML
eukprot:scaffold12052_cov73-Attheya_sp.AAC.1